MNLVNGQRREAAQNRKSPIENRKKAARNRKEPQKPAMESQYCDNVFPGKQQT
jgi:hypothetical protein